MAKPSEQIKWVYMCTSTSCGNVEYSKFAPSSSKRCPNCGSMMLRKENK